MRRADGARKIFKIWPTRMAKKIPFWCNYQNYYRYNNVDLGKEMKIRRLLEHLHIVASGLIENHARQTSRVFMEKSVAKFD